MIASEGQTEPIYRLKHRLTGAVVLVLVAIFTIPMLLKDPVGYVGSAQYTEGERSTFRSRIEPYEETKSNHEDQSGSLPTTVISSDQMTTITIGASTNSPDENSQQGGAANDRSEVEKQPKATVSDLADTQEAQQTRPALVPIGQSNETRAEVIPKSTASQTEQKTTTSKVNSQSADANTPKQKTKPVVLTKKPEESADSSTDQVKVAKNNVSEKPKKTISDESATPEEGVWVVRVGTFSKASNVASVSGLLTKNGLKARTTQVQTSFGAATRIWLGPYADKNSAITISAQLKALTGEKGYITRHTP